MATSFRRSWNSNMQETRIQRSSTQGDQWQPAERSALHPKRGSQAHKSAHAQRRGRKHGRAETRERHATGTTARSEHKANESTSYTNKQKGHAYALGERNCTNETAFIYRLNDEEDSAHKWNEIDALMHQKLTSGCIHAITRNLTRPSTMMRTFKATALVSHEAVVAHGGHHFLL